ncbi:MAG TPA: hypothetical protein DDW52_09990 [Planctomycetaceae bacterium]|nr:hypothetical protein [Planctomycetaceae bacterium]
MEVLNDYAVSALSHILRLQTADLGTSGWGVAAGRTRMSSQQVGRLRGAMLVPSRGGHEGLSAATLF